MVAPVGTTATSEVALQLVIAVAVAPLNATVPAPCVEPKFVPVIVTDAPTPPDVGDRFVMLGAGTTVKLTPLVATPLTVTTTLPVVAPVGTGTTMLVSFQLVGVAAFPLNFTVLVPCVEPKLVPVIVTDAPTAPEAGDKLVTLGITVNDEPLLATPLTVTTTGPVLVPLGTGAMIAPVPQLVGVATTPLNVTVLLLWVFPKFVPVIVTGAPSAPVVGDKFVIVGVAVKATALL